MEELEKALESYHDECFQFWGHGYMAGVKSLKLVSLVAAHLDALERRKETEPPEVAFGAVNAAWRESSQSRERPKSTCPQEIWEAASQFVSEYLPSRLDNIGVAQARWLRAIDASNNTIPPEKRFLWSVPESILTPTYIFGDLSRGLHRSRDGELGRTSGRHLLEVQRNIQWRSSVSPEFFRARYLCGYFVDQGYPHEQLLEAGCALLLMLVGWELVHPEYKKSPRPWKLFIPIQYPESY